MSPYLFNIMAEMAMRKVLGGFDGRILIGGRRISKLRYAGDIVLLASYQAELLNWTQLKFGLDWKREKYDINTKHKNTNTKQENVYVFIRKTLKVQGHRSR